MRTHAHRLLTRSTAPSAVFREFGSWRWLVVPLGAVLAALFVLVVAALAGVAAPPTY